MSATFQIKDGSVYRIDHKVRMQVKFKKDDGSDSGAWQWWECDSLDDDQIYYCLQHSADEWAARPAPDNTVPTLTTDQWMTDPNMG